MKIIFDNIIYSLQRSGGGSVYWTELIKRFNDLKEEEVSFYEQIEENDNIFRKELQLNNVKKETFLKLAIRRYLNFTIPITSKTIFHSSYFRISKSKKAINITTIHDFTTEKFRKGLAKWVNLYQKRHAVLNSDGIICISENTKNDLITFVPNVDISKIKVIYNGVSKEFYPLLTNLPISEQAPEFLAIQDYKYLLYIGHRTSYKNFPLAVKAAAQLKGEFKLVIIGEPLNENETNMLEDLLKGDYLVFSGLNNEKLNMLYNRAFALLYPSSYEGFGIPLLEAMKTHCPVIASNNSSIPEVAGNGAVLITQIDENKIVNAINQLKNIEFREKLIERGIAQSSKFDWDLTFQQYMDFYKKLYNEK